MPYTKPEEKKVVAEKSSALPQYGTMSPALPLRKRSASSHSFLEKQFSRSVSPAQHSGEDSLEIELSPPKPVTLTDVLLTPNLAAVATAEKAKEPTRRSSTPVTPSSQSRLSTLHEVLLSRTFTPLAKASEVDSDDDASNGCSWLCFKRPKKR